MNHTRAQSCCEKCKCLPLENSRQVTLFYICVTCSFCGELSLYRANSTQRWLAPYEPTASECCPQCSDSLERAAAGDQVIKCQWPSGTLILHQRYWLGLGPLRPSETCGTLWELRVDWWAARPLAGYRHTPKFETKTWGRDSWELSNPCTLSLSPISTVLTGHQNWACAYISPLFIGIPYIKEKIYERRPFN